MKRLAGAGIAAAVLVSSVLAAARPADGKPGAVAICHAPPGNPGNVHSISVGAKAAAHHVSGHNDFYDLDHPRRTAELRRQPDDVVGGAVAYALTGC